MNLLRMRYLIRSG